MRNLLPLSAAVLAITVLFACGDDDSSGGGAAAGNNGAGAASNGNAPAGNCTTRCAALPAVCDVDPSNCAQICAGITERELACAESTKCDQTTYDACVGQGAAGSSAGTGGNGGSGGGTINGGAAGSTPNGGAGGDQNLGEPCDAVDITTPGTCAARTSTEAQNVCSSFASKKNGYACCRKTSLEGCSEGLGTSGGVTFFCCP
jgi:hypothetical protein